MYTSLFQTRLYATRRMRLQQALAARTKAAWEPVRSAIEDEPVLGSRITEKKREEQKTKPLKSVVQYLQARLIGRPKTGAEKREAWLNMKKRQFSPVFLDQLKPQMRKWCSALKKDELPPEYLPEVAVVGRSNTGKSTLLNALSGRGGALVSSRPGSTQSVDFYKIGKPAMLCLVDLPGYGYAEATEAKRLQWTEFSLDYLRSRKNLKRVLLLIDARWGVFDGDTEMLAFLIRHRVSWQVVLTKCDLVPAKHLARRITLIQEELKPFALSAGSVIPLSAKKKQGMDDLRKILTNLKLDKKTLSLRLQKLKSATKPPQRAAENPQGPSEPLSADETLKRWGIHVDGTQTDDNQASDGPREEEPVLETENKGEQIKTTNIKAMKRARVFLDNEVLPLNDAPVGLTAPSKKAKKLRPQPVKVIGTADKSVVPKGIARWKIVGRPESKAPKLKPRVEVNDLVKAVEFDKKKKLKWDEKIAKLQKEDVDKSSQADRRSSGRGAAATSKQGPRENHKKSVRHVRK